MSVKVQAILDGKDAEQISALETFIDAGFKAAEVVVEKEVIKEVPAAEMTREEAIEKFGLGEAVKVLADKKTGTISAIKATGRCTMSDEELAGKNQNELDQLLTLAGQRHAVDFSGQGAPRAAATTDETVPPAAPDLSERIRAARSAKK